MHEDAQRCIKMQFSRCGPVKSKSTLLPNFLFVLLYINCKSIMGWDVRSRRQYYTNIDELKKWTKILHSFVNSRENPISENILRVLAFVTCISLPHNYISFPYFFGEIKVVCKFDETSGETFGTFNFRICTFLAVKYFLS